jgi:methylase of polypeptide subunit release factors
MGCGSGNVSLPLAALLPRCRFTLVDRNAYAVQLAQSRAEHAGLSNVDRFLACSISEVSQFPRLI